MCLITTWKEPKIAQEDMKVFKVLHMNRCSTYYTKGLQYLKNKLYETTLKEVEESSDCRAFDHTGGKWMDENYPGWHEVDKTLLEGIKFIGQGFHSVLAEDRLNDKFNKLFDRVIFRATIPKGSEYYLDETGLCVSNKIIVH